MDSRLFATDQITIAQLIVIISQSNSTFNIQHFDRIVYFIWNNCVIGGVEVKELLDHAIVAVDVYNEILDQIPWSQFKEAHNEFHNNPTDRSRESAELLGGVHTNFLNSEDAYFSLSTDTREWCGFTKGMLPVYDKLYDNSTPAKLQAQKKLLLDVIDNQLGKMNAWETSLTVMATNFREASDKLTTLIHRDLSQSSKVFYERLNRKADQANRDVSETKTKIQTEKPVIENLRAQFANSTPNESITAESRQSISNSIQNIVAKCNDYRQKHSVV